MLTKTQLSVLKNSGSWSRVAENYFYEAGDGVTTRTLDAMAKKGLLNSEARPFRYWLTEKGFDVLENMRLENEN